MLLLLFFLFNKKKEITHPSEKVVFMTHNCHQIYLLLSNNNWTESDMVCSSNSITCLWNTIKNSLFRSIHALPSILVLLYRNRCRNLAAVAYFLVFLSFFFVPIWHIAKYQQQQQDDESNPLFYDSGVM